MAEGEKQSSHSPLTVYHFPASSSAPGDVAAGETARASATAGARRGERDELHTQFGEQSFEDLFLLRVEVAVGFLSQRAEQVDAVFGEREVYLARGDAGVLADAESRRRR